MKTLIRFVTL